MSRRPPRAERERVRADAAEARAEELRWAEVAARSDAGSWKSRFRSCRRRLSEANEEAKELRRAAKAAPSLRAEAVRLETLLSEAGNGSSETGAIEALGKEVARLREALAKPEAVEDPAGWRSGEAGCDPASREEAQRLRATIRALRKGDHPAQQGGGPAEQADRPAGQAAGGGGAEVGEPQGDRQEAVPRVPWSLQGTEDIARLRGQGPVAVRRGLPAAAMPWKCPRPGRTS